MCPSRHSPPHTSLGLSSPVRNRTANPTPMRSCSHLSFYITATQTPNTTKSSSFPPPGTAAHTHCPDRGRRHEASRRSESWQQPFSSGCNLTLSHTNNHHCDILNFEEPFSRSPRRTSLKLWEEKCVGSGLLRCRQQGQASAQRAACCRAVMGEDTVPTDTAH